MTKALDDPSRDVRVSAIRLAERWLGKQANPIQAAVLKRLDDADWAVRDQLAASLGALPPGPRETRSAALLERHGGRSDGAGCGAERRARQRSGRCSSRLTVRPSRCRLTPQREAAITMLAATIVRGGQDVAIQKLLAAIGRREPAAWQRSALLRGAEVALLGAAMPGTPPRRRGGPAGRGRSVSDVSWRTRRSGRRLRVSAGAARRTPPPRRPAALSREPAALSAVAAGTGDHGDARRGVLARVEWPGKPGAAAPIPPLTPDEQQRFNAGQEVYKNICQACHQPDGRGQEQARAEPPRLRRWRSRRRTSRRGFCSTARKAPSG